MEKPVYVIGHKNPDTDSVCSAVCYARLKSLITGKNYIAKRAGHLNEETQYVFDSFKIKPPEYINDVRPQVKDVDIYEIDGVDEQISIKEAWNIMKSNNVVTLPVTDGEELKGLVTIGDISRSYFEVYDSDILARANTRFMNIVDTLKARVITGNTEQTVDSGKVVIAAANPELMEQFIEDGDIVILGNRYEAQLCAIEMNARCIVVCEGAQVSKTIVKVADENNCAVIVTDYDTYTVARLINQSMPISYYMMKRSGLVTFCLTDYIEDIQDVMSKKRFSNFPVVDENGKYAGMISRRNLLRHGRKQLILVDHNERSQAVSGVDTADILEIIDHHRIGSIQTMSPVYFRNQPLGSTATIIYQMYKENNLVPDRETAELLCAAIISDTLILKSPTCTQTDIDACQSLAKLSGIDIDSCGRAMFKAGSNISSKTPKELFNRDFKKFAVGDIVVGVGQVNCMEADEIANVQKIMGGYIDEVTGENGLDMAFFMITNVLDGCSEVLCGGKNAVQTLSMAFNVQPAGESVHLDGVVSRKKQLFPVIMEALQQ